MSAGTNHPDSRELTDYVLGRLEEETLESISAHVETCTECQETLTHLDASDDTLVRGIATDVEDDPFVDESQCEAAVSAIRRINVAPQGDETCAPASEGEPSSAEEDSLDTLRDYQLLAKLGEGGMGAVYRARHLRLDRLVALKVLPAARMRQPEALARFHREMKAVGNLNHPNIVQAHDAGEVDDKHFLVMELVDGVDLSAMVDREGPLEVADACELIRQAAVGLDHAHRHGLVHRDVKPSNLMLNRAGLVKVLDLGLARVLGEEQAVAARSRAPNKRPASVFQSMSGELTGADQIMGTPDYMAPEQLNDSRAVDARSDVYSLGATLYKLLAGAAPFTGDMYDTLAKKMVGLAEHAAPPLSERRGELPKELVRIVERMLAKDPADRYASPAQVAAALAPFCKGQDVRRLAEASPSAERMAAPTQLGMQLETQHLRPAPATSGAKDGGRRKWLVGVAAAGMAAFAALVIYVQTNNGTLVIRSEAPHQVEVEVLDNEILIRRAKIESGANNVTLPVGDYQVRLLGDHGDRIIVSDGHVSIARGDDTQVTLEWKEPQRSARQASDELREQYSALREAYRESSLNDRLDVLKEHAPALADMGEQTGDGDVAGVDALLQFVLSLPEQTQQTMLDQGYVKWRGAQLDSQRQSQLNQFLVQLLTLGDEQTSPPPETPPVGELISPFIITAADVGLAVVHQAETSSQVVVAFIMAPNLPTPVVAPLAGDLGQWNEPSVQRAWSGAFRDQVTSLQDEPESELPPPLEAPKSAAGQTLRERYAALLDAYREGMPREERLAFLKTYSPTLLGMEMIAEGKAPSGADALLQLATSLPDEVQQTLLDKGYVKWRCTSLGMQRQMLVNQFLVRLLQSVPAASSAFGDASLEDRVAALFMAADFGFAVLNDASTNEQVVAAYLAAPNSLTPIIMPIVGKQDPKFDPAVESEWRRRVQALQDKPYSERLKPLPARFGTKFHPAMQMPITQDGVTKELVDGTFAWRIDAAEARTVRLFEVEAPAIEDCVLTYSAELKTEGVEGRVYLEMWCDVPGHGESFSKGFHHAVTGTNDWASYQTPFLLREGERPETIKLNLVIEGAGTVWIKQVVLTAAPARPSATPAATSGD